MGIILNSLICKTKDKIPSGVTGREQGVSFFPDKVNVKTGPPVADILIFSVLLVFSWLLFLACLGCCHFLASTDIYNIQIHYHFLTFFLSIG